MFAFFFNIFIVVVPGQGRSHTALAGSLPAEEMTADQQEISNIAKKWAEVRHLSKEEAESQLDGEWLEAHKRFHDKYDEDMTKMTEIATMLQKAIEPPRVQKKTKGQKRRDAWAKVQAREAARAAN